VLVLGGVGTAVLASDHVGSLGVALADRLDERTVAVAS
jgi:hypothetical protein